ncbi:MAG: RluA family pseudouridine synthase [Rhizobiales bacterium]|nr:RluA family pseudouridine synthase [Hyphomicrobiales bacterium]
MSGVRQVTVAAGETDMRLDRWFKARFPEFTHVQLQKLLRGGQIRVDGGRVKADTRLAAGQVVRVPPSGAGRPASSASADGAGDDLANGTDRGPRARGAALLSDADRAFVRSLVVMRDAEVIAIAKPAGLAVQGGSGTKRHLDGLLDGLKFDAPERPRLVHRLDKDTSGVMLLARTRAAANWLGRALKERAARKLYWALVIGVPTPSEGRIDAPLVKRGGTGDERVRIAEPGEDGAQRAVTELKVVERVGRSLSWLALSPLTGRTHQLRAHLAGIGHPIVGDGKYGGGEAHPGGEIARKLHLHARAIEIVKPDGRKLRVEVPLSGHMLETWKSLGLDAGRPAELLAIDEGR